MLPAEQLLYVRIHPNLKRIVVEEARVGESLGDVATRLFCKALKLDPADYAMTRQTPGRKPGSTNRKKKSEAK